MESDAVADLTVGAAMRAMSGAARNTDEACSPTAQFLLGHDWYRLDPCT